AGLPHQYRADAIGRLTPSQDDSSIDKAKMPSPRSMTQVRADISRSGSSSDPKRPSVSRNRPRRLGVTVLAVAAVVGLFVLLYAVSEHAGPGGSDGATVVLEGQAIAHGNILLRGWSMSLDSFWTIDALWYLVVGLLWGVQPALIHAVPALIATAVIVMAVLMAVEERR